MQKCNILRIYALAIRLFAPDPNAKDKDNGKDKDKTPAPAASVGAWALLFQLGSWCKP
jgi:hypothetical protein